MNFLVKSKILVACLLILSVVLGLSSCLIVPGTGGQSSAKIPDDGLVFSPDRAVSAVVSDDNDQFFVTKTYNTIINDLHAIGITAQRITDKTAQTGSEIVVGPSARAASQAAEALINGADPEGIAYALCYKDGALAIVAVNEVSYTKALAVFRSLISGDTLRVATDYSAYVNKTLEEYEGDLLEEAKAEEAYDFEHRFDEIALLVDNSGLSAIRGLYEDFLGEDVYLWYADLYDAGIGAFYFSDSSRNYNGFLPDLESTYQILNDLRISGMFDIYDDMTDALPIEMQEALVAWVQSLESSSDGYFYHEQWGKDIDAVKKGRDLDWAIALLNWFGAKPLYPTAIDRLSGASTASAVAKVVAVASEDYLSSEEAFCEWLYSYEEQIKTNSHGAGHTIGARSTQFVAAGYGDIACDFFDRIQREVYEEQVANGETPTGLWQNVANYTSLAGLYKIGIIYSAAGRTVNYLDLCVDSALAVIASDEKLDDIVDVYNPWAGLNTAISMMKKANKISDHEIYDLDAAYGKVRQSIAGLLDVTFGKMSQFRKEDGSFSYYTNRSAASMYNAPISLGLNEGDVNATHLMIGSMCSAIFSSMGVERPKTWSSADLDVFLSVIEEAGDIVKAERETGVSYDFEGYSEGDVPSGVTGAEIATDPKNNENSALAFNSVVGTKDNATFSVAFGESYSCAYFDTDIMLSNVTHATSTNNIPTHQVRFAAGGSYVYMLTFTAKDGMLIIGDNSSTSSGGNARNNLISVPLDEWFNLRVEIYSGDAEQFRAKIYVNGHCLVISDNFYGSEKEDATPNTKITSIMFYGMEKAGSTLYFDDFEGDITNDKFSDADYEGVVESNERFYDFEDEKFDFVSVETSFPGSYIGISDEVAKDDYSLVLHKESTEDNHRDHYVFGAPEIKSDTITLSFDVNFDYASGGGMQIAMGTWGKSPYVLNIMYSGSAYILGCTRNTADTAATVVFKGGELTSGWHNIRITMTVTDDPDEFCADIYLDDEPIVSSYDFYHGGKDGAVPATNVPEITFKLIKPFIGDVYLDNVHIIYE